LGGLPTPRKILGSLLADGFLPWVRSRCRWRTPLPQRMRGPSDHQAQTVWLVRRNPSLYARSLTIRPSVVDRPRFAESTASSTHCSDWRSDQCQHTFWRLCWGSRRKDISDHPRWPVQRIFPTFIPATLLSRLCRLYRLRISKGSRSTRIS
jgi:hypothetical protein